MRIFRDILLQFLDLGGSLDCWQISCPVGRKEGEMVDTLRCQKERGLLENCLFVDDFASYKPLSSSYILSIYSG